LDGKNILAAIDYLKELHERISVHDGFQNEVIEEDDDEYGSSLDIVYERLEKQEEYEKRILRMVVHPSNNIKEVKEQTLNRALEELMNAMGAE
jgi:endonuclease IV